MKAVRIAANVRCVESGSENAGYYGRGGGGGRSTSTSNDNSDLPF